ncbi:multicopper oxidase domain-containing protein, partial [Kaarinaea lacus]
TVSPTAGLITSEDATAATVSLVLDAQPTDTVSISVTSSDTSEGSVAPGSLQFDAANWDTPQTVTVTGVDDADVDGDIAYNVDFAAQSNDTNYNGISIDSVSLTNQDNDVAQPPPTTNYQLFIEPGTLDITASEISGNGATSFPVWGYSTSNSLPGVSPGLVLEAVVGQSVSVEIINDHILDHAFEVVGLLASTNIPSGESVTVNFTPTEAGVYRYGDPDPRSRAMGMFGAVVVRPADGSNTAWTNGPAFDQERTWVVTDMDDSWNRTLWFNPVPTTYEPNYFLLNGMNGFAAKQDAASTLQGVVGETILVRIINAGQYDQSLHFHANHFQIISQDGVKVNDIADAPWVTTVNVKRGSTAIVLYTLDKLGTYPVHVHSANMETGNGVYLNGTATFIIAQ